MKMIDDLSLTEYQRKLKLYLNLEFDLEDADDIKAVLKSMLKDLEAEGYLASDDVSPSLL